MTLFDYMDRHPITSGIVALFMAYYVLLAIITICERKGSK